MMLTRLLNDAGRDVRYGARVLFRHPLFSAVAIASLALGIGGAASVFTVLNAVILRNLPVPNPQQLFVAEKVTPDDRHGRYSWPSVEQVRAAVQGRAEVCAFTSTFGMQVRPEGESSVAAERGMVQLVSGECFGALRQQPQAGRLLQPSDNAHLGAHPVAVISDSLWERLFERSPGAIGRQIILNGTSFSVVGVAARGFFGPIVSIRNPEVWIPLVMQHEVRYAANASSSTPADPQKPWATQDRIEWLRVLLRIPDPSEVPAVASVLTAQYRREDAARAGVADAEAQARIERQQVVLESGARGISNLRTALSTPLLVLLGMVGVLLVIACGNLASLLISRANAREREMAIRLSIGAGRGRVVRQLLAETLLLAGIGGALGLLVAAWGRDALLAMFPTGAGTVDLDTGFDWRVLGFATAVTLLAGLLAGILPALRGTRVSLADAMKTQARTVGAGGLRAAVLGKTLVAAQIAFCLLLLVLAALFTRSMHSLLQVDVGYDRQSLLVATIDVRSIGLPAEQRGALYARLIERIEALPGVRGASLSLNGPLGTGELTSSLSVEGYTPRPDERMITNEEVVTAGYFDTVGLRIIEGRGFTASDRADGANSTLINQTMAARYFPSGAIGRRWNYDDTIDAASPVIVGVVEDAKYTDLKRVVPNMVYHLADSRPHEILRNMEVRTSVPPAQLVSTLRKTLAEAEPALPVFDIFPLEQRVNRGIANERLVARLTTTFGVMALLLACLGLYGTISYGVTRRVTELGVRMALGAARGDVLWLVIREAAILVAAGVLAGAPLAYLAGNSIASLLHGVRALDPASYLVAAAALIGVAGVAAFLPAHRASRIDPMVALRKD